MRRRGPLAALALYMLIGLGVERAESERGGRSIVVAAAWPAALAYGLTVMIRDPVLFHRLGKECR